MQPTSSEITELIRRILVDHARGHRRAKRGSGVTPLPLEDVVGLGSTPHPELVAVDDALKDLADLDARQAQIVEMKFFIGLTLEQIAEVFGVSLSTVNREWKSARMWLLRALDNQA